MTLPPFPHHGVPAKCSSPTIFLTLLRLLPRTFSPLSRTNFITMFCFFLLFGLFRRLPSRFLYPFCSHFAPPFRDVLDILSSASSTPDVDFGCDVFYNFRTRFGNAIVTSGSEDSLFAPKFLNPFRSPPSRSPSFSHKGCCAYPLRPPVNDPLAK